MSTMLMRSNALTSHHTSHSPAGAPRQQYLGTLKILLAGGSRLRPKYEIVRTFRVPLRLDRPSRSGTGKEAAICNLATSLRSLEIVPLLTMLQLKLPR